MRFGIHNPSWMYGPDPNEMFEGVKHKAQWAERHGFTWFSVMDHLIQIGGVGKYDERFMEAWTVLASLAAVTEKIRLATLVTSVSYRNPALLAKMAAGVDIISRGRLTLGMGAGWNEREYKQYGYEFPARPATRIRQLEEAVRLIKSMWTDERATFHGKYFQAEEAMLEPKPVQRPRPPILIGGSGEQLLLRVVARQADACNVFGDPAEVRRKFSVLRAHCEAEGRDFDSIERTNLISFLLATDEQALQAKRERLAVPAGQWGYFITVTQAVDEIGRYKDAGVQLLISSIYKNDQESLELFASEVMPHFADSQPEPSATGG
jgi:F420-dependent oxidoreductase-like protein